MKDSPQWPRLILGKIRVTLTWDGSRLNLNWTGGEPSYQVQRATDLALGNWMTIEANATPPLSIDVEGATSFYLVVGQ